jgi:hypothetical protein
MHIFQSPKHNTTTVLQDVGGFAFEFRHIFFVQPAQIGSSHEFQHILFDGDLFSMPVGELSLKTHVSKDFVQNLFMLPLVFSH